MAHGAKIDRKQEQAIAALLTFPTVGEAATSCGINEATLRRWMLDTAFSAAYADARRACMQNAVGALQQSTSAAVSALTAICGDTTAPASSRVSAARSILEFGFRGVEMLDIEARLSALEATLHPEGTNA